jgi:trk system potassium uptake protein TrkH
MTDNIIKNSNKSKSDIAPTKVIALSFLSIILAGTVLLSLPVSSRAGTGIGFLNALFTATSATCVTGLVIADTLNTWSVFGQVIILILIQIGGLGTITLVTFFTVIVGKKIGLKGRLLAQESLGHYSFRDILKLIKKIVIITFSVEFTGAVLLSFTFIPRYGASGIFNSIFHSVSAFCNAGFDIIGSFQSFTGFNNNPFLLLVIMLLIITGGLGFIVWQDIMEYKKTKKLLLHTKIVLIMSSVLIVGGALYFLIFEYNNSATIGNMDFINKAFSSLFHSITTRTAGFNNLDLDSMTETSKIGTIILMYIGAAPGSTAGGIKITTISLIIIAIISQLKGRRETIIFKERVPFNIINRALSIIGISIIWIVVFTIIILAAEKDKSFINVLYEVTSAFATVGLSSVSTPELTVFSKTLIMITMFVGRIGPITFALALTLKPEKKREDIVYPQGKVIV